MSNNQKNTKRVKFFEKLLSQIDSPAFIANGTSICASNSRFSEIYGTPTDVSEFLKSFTSNIDIQELGNGLKIFKIRDSDILRLQESRGRLASALSLL